MIWTNITAHTLSIKDSKIYLDEDNEHFLVGKKILMMKIGIHTGNQYLLNMCIAFCWAKNCEETIFRALDFINIA